MYSRFFLKKFYPFLLYPKRTSRICFSYNFKLLWDFYYLSFHIQFLKEYSGSVDYLYMCV